LSIYEAIAKMTVLPAVRIGISKGSLAIGKDADVVVFDYDTIRDTADFSQPLSPPIGIKWVLIDGGIAVRNDELVNQHRGKAIRV